MAREPRAVEPEPLTEREAEGLRLLLELVERLKEAVPQEAEEEAA